jgi:hypothetical protein
LVANKSDHIGSVKNISNKFETISCRPVNGLKGKIRLTKAGKSLG